MEVIYSPEAIDDLKYWRKSGNKAILKKIQTLIFGIQESPATFFLFNTSALNLGGKLLAVSVLIAGIFNFSALFESKKYALALEFIRIIASAGALLFVFKIAGIIWLPVLLAWVLVSSAWLFLIKRSAR